MKIRYMMYILIGVLLWHPLCIEASENLDVIITNMSYDEEFCDNFETRVKVQFLDEKLYNENIFLSYHIFDESGNNMIEYENQRIKINLNDNGEMVCNVAIDLKEILKNTEEVILKYDIVDQSNLYWFAGNPNINFSTTSIRCRIDSTKANLRILSGGVTGRPIIFTINLIFSVMTISMVVYIKKKKIRCM